jgi:hypothetical protein
MIPDKVKIGCPDIRKSGGVELVKNRLEEPERALGPVPLKVIAG